MKKHYFTPVLLAVFAVVALGWFVAGSTAEQAPHPKKTTVSSASSPIRTAGVTAGRHPLGASALMASHEQQVAFTPDGENVTPSFHVEMEALKENINAAPQDTSALLRMARLKQDGHQTEEAVAYYEQYLSLRPEGRQAWLDLARGYGELERWQDALNATQGMLKHFPDDPAALYNLGAILANTGKSSEAREAWERVVKQDHDAEMKAMAEGALKRLSSMHP